MVLHLSEYTEQSSKKGKMLNHYDKLQGYLHEMPVEDIMKHINRNGARSAYLQQYAILDYFIWLHKNFEIDLAEKNFQLKQLLNQDYKIFVGFYTLKDLKQAISEGLVEAENENSVNLPDYSGLVAIFYLEWYGILPDAAISIKLEDVSNDGRTVYIPAQDRTIEIDDKSVANYFAEYKKKTGFKRFKNSEKEIPYPQNTFYRNTSFRGNEITEKTIYNARLKFVDNSEDERFAKKRVYYSGRYAEMIKFETELGKEFSGSDSESCKIISKIFNSDMNYNQIAHILREYAVFKQGYLKRL